MYKELSLITLILGVASLITELLSLFKPGNPDLNFAHHKTEDGLMIGTILTEIVCSVYMMKNIATISSAKVKVFALLILGLLVSSLVLRAKSGIFLKEEGKSHSMHNASSFLLCLVGVVWVTFWFLKKPTPADELVIVSIPLTDSMRQREEDYQRRLGRGGAVTRSADDYYLYGSQEMLPSYYELPIPPAYTKVQAPNLSVLLEAHTSSTSRDFATNTEDVLNSINQAEPQTSVTTTTTTTVTSITSNTADTNDTTDYIDTSADTNTDTTVATSTTSTNTATTDPTATTAISDDTTDTVTTITTTSQPTT